MTATKNCPQKSATRRCRKFPTCSWLAPRKPKPAPSPSAIAAKATSAPSPSPKSSNRSTAKSNRTLHPESPSNVAPFKALLFGRPPMPQPLSRRTFLALTSGALATPSLSWAARATDAEADDEVPALLDHIIIGCNDLDRGIDLVKESTGVRATLGGV